jgi:hypothetical protein
MKYQQNISKNMYIKNNNQHGKTLHLSMFRPCHFLIEVNCQMDYLPHTTQKDVTNTIETGRKGANMSSKSCVRPSILPHLQSVNHLKSVIGIPCEILSGIH